MHVYIMQVNPYNYNQNAVNRYSYNVLRAAGALTGANRIIQGITGSPVTRSDLIGAGQGLMKAGKWAYNAVLPKRSTKSYGKSYKRRSVLKPLSKKAPLRAKISRIQKSVNATQGILTYRKRTTSRLLSAVNQKSYGVYADVNNSLYETVLAELRFFNPSAPSTLIQGSGASGTYFRNYLFSKVYTKSKVMNNYQVPCKVTLMVCTPKEDTSINPATAFENGLVDVGNPGSQSTLTYFNDSDEFRRLWKVQKTITKVLQPGKSFVCYYGTKDVIYDPALVDSHGQAYQRKFKASVVLVKVEGVIGHDTSADQQGVIQAGVDMLFDQTLEVKYAAGADIRFVVVSDGSDTFTNGGVISSKPVADNLGYSVS